MKLIALDTVHVSSASSENILEGQRFEVSDAEGKSLIDRGLAKKAEGASARNKAEGRSRSNKSAPIRPISGGSRRKK
jgi:hypothetical protein